MGARGPAPTPTNILKLHGSWRGKTRAGEPQARFGRPRCPAWLNSEQKKLFRAFCRMLERDFPGVLTVIDGAQIERYVVHVLRWREVQTAIQKACGAAGYLAAAMNDKLRQALRRLETASRMLDESLRRTEDKFGLTPSARAALGMQLSAPAPADGEGIEGFARQRA